MLVSLPHDKKGKFFNLRKVLLEGKMLQIEKLAVFIGNLVASFAIKLGELNHGFLENNKSVALTKSKGNFDNLMELTDESKIEIRWWLLNIGLLKNALLSLIQI